MCDTLWDWGSAGAGDHESSATAITMQEGFRRPFPCTQSWENSPPSGLAEERLRRPPLQSAKSMPSGRGSAGDLAAQHRGEREGGDPAAAHHSAHSAHGGEEFHGRLLHYARGPTPQPSLSTTPLRYGAPHAHL